MAKVSQTRNWFRTCFTVVKKNQETCHQKNAVLKIKCISDPTIKTHEDPQMAFDVAREYKEHVDSVKRDRQLEEWLEVG